MRSWICEWTENSSSQKLRNCKLEEKRIEKEKRDMFNSLVLWVYDWEPSAYQWS